MSFVRPQVFESGLPRKARVGDGWLATLLRTNQTTDSNQVITVPAILGGLYTRSGTNTNRTDTTATAADILAQLPDMDIGDTFMLLIGNQTANSLIIAGGASVTASGNLTILTLTSKWFLFTKTSATTMTMAGF